MPTATSARNAGANAARSLSADGLQSLQVNEGLRRVYYNDSANNCTYGVGSLAHRGPCTAGELGRPVPDALVRQQLGIGIQQAEHIVRESVRDHELTQDQFDAAVSFAYNMAHRARAVLSPANRGNMAAVAQNMNAYIYVHDHDAHGRAVGPRRRSDGLVARRRREAAPFLAPAPAPAPASGATP